MLFHVVFFQKLTERSNVSHAAAVVDDGGDDVGDVVVYEGVWWSLSGGMWALPSTEV